MAPLPKPAFCSALHENDGDDEKWISDLDSSAQAFLAKLNLPRVHPHCQEGYRYPPHLVTRLSDPFPPPEVSVHSSSILSNLITGAYRVFPPLLAMAELWLRFFAIAIGPLAITYLVSEALQPVGKSEMSKKRTTFLLVADVLACILGVASCLVLLTDSLYVMEFGRSLGWSLWIACSLLALHACVTRPRLLPHRTKLLTGLAMLWIITIHVLLHSEDTDTTRGIDLPTYPAGLYVSPRATSLIHRLVEAWPESQRTYSVAQGATSWLVTGDARTGIPFLVNSPPALGRDYFKRFFVLDPSDDEVVALDIAFPTNSNKTRFHDASKPLYVVLHGLNGGSDEPYVREFTASRNAEQSTVMIMVARGMMDLPVRGWNVFHGARVSDIAAAARAIRKSGAVGPRQVLAGVGFSMGAIILANYVAQSGKACDLDAAISIAGSLDSRENMDNIRSRRLWQPLLAQTLRDRFVTGRFDARFRHRLGEKMYHEMLRVPALQDLDRTAIVTYFGYRDLAHYYSDMSAMGDQSFFRTRRRPDDGDTHIGRIANVAIPLCILNSLDDPLISWRAAAGRDPQALVDSGKGNLMLLLTKGGGHVGWPIGMFPALYGWSWMNNVARDFVLAYAKASGKTKER